MTYFCLIETSGSSAAHMEFLNAETHDAAVQEAERLLARHFSAVAADICSGDEIVSRIYAPTRRSESVTA